VRHLEPVFGGMEHEPFVRMRTDGLRLVKHGHVHVACTDKRSFARRPEGLNYQPMHRVRVTPAGAELRNGDAQLSVPLDFLPCCGHYLVVWLPYLTGQSVIKL